MSTQEEKVAAISAIARVLGLDPFTALAGGVASGHQNIARHNGAAGEVLKEHFDALDAAAAQATGGFPVAVPPSLLAALNDARRKTATWKP